MRSFDYRTLPSELLAPDISNMVSAIHEYRGKQELYLEAHADALETLCKVARVQSTGASNRIEGIHTTERRLNELMEERAEPRNRSEAEIAGYRDVLSTIHESYDYIDITPSVILQLHRDLYRHTDSGFAGHFKDSDNFIAEFDEAGKMHVRFKPLPAVATPEAVEQLCATLGVALRAGVYDPLLLDMSFVFDFICIHPFNDGNGRMSRLLTLLLLYRSGYLVGKYVSIEMGIERTRETYYESLEESSGGWSSNANGYSPFVRYMLGVVLASYRDFESRVEGLIVSRKSKPERVEAVLERHLGKVTKRDILAECPDISTTTVERALRGLLASGRVEKVGAGRATGYVYKR